MFFRVRIVLLGIFMMIMPSSWAQSERFPSVADTAAINQMIQTASRYAVNLKFDSAYAVYEGAFRMSRQVNYNYGILRSLNGLGNVEAELGDYSMSVYFLEQAIRYAQKIDEGALSLPYLHSNLATTHANWGNEDDALQHFEKALQASEAAPEAQFPIIALYVNMGYLLNKSARFRDALYYLNKGVTSAWHQGDFANQALLYAHMGNSYLGLNIRDSAGLCYKLSLSEARLVKMSHTIHMASKGLANLALKQNQPELAIYYLKQAASVVASLHPEDVSKYSISMGVAYSKVGDLFAAQYYLQQALDIAENTGLLQSRMDAHLQLATLYAHKSMYDSAYYHHQEAWVVADSIRKYSRSRSAQHVETRLRSTLKDKELREKELIIELKEREVKTRNLWIGFTVTGLIISCVSIFLLGKYYRNKQALKDANMQQLLRQKQLQEFHSILEAEEKERNRIARDLHDSVMVQFSVLKMNLSAFVGRPTSQISKEELIPHIEQLNAATQTLRNVAHHLMPDLLLEAGLAEALHYFCKSLQPTVPFQLRFEQMDEIPRFDIQTEIAIYRIVQELIQNIIKHANATWALVQISYNDNCLGIEVEDNGVGIDPDKPHQGMGLKNIATRVKHLNGHFHISDGDGTSVSLEFNIGQLQRSSLENLTEIA